MTNQRQLTDTRHFKLLVAIQGAKKVPCEDYPEFMFPEDIPDPDKRQAAVSLAKALCQQCPIIEDCFTYALETGQAAGIWGGTEAHER
jgi:hypothetical protein